MFQTVKQNTQDADRAKKRGGSECNDDPESFENEARENVANNFADG